MKKLFALLIAAMLLGCVAAAETVDAYTTASTTKTVLSGDGAGNSIRSICAGTRNDETETPNET